ncbi:MAG: protein kinase [Gemmatimonadetes bacterium]|nr:protein kinase [Gemmatimonadota bacterium]
MAIHSGLYLSQGRDIHQSGYRLGWVEERPTCVRLLAAGGGRAVASCREQTHRRARRRRCGSVPPVDFPSLPPLVSTSDLTHIRRQLADRYALERELGRGGMGAVYLARDLQLDRPVALKVLPVEFAADPALHERFLREMRTTASFSHPNIVPVHSVEERDGLVAYAMGYVEGESLAQRVQRSGPLSVRELVRLLQDVGYALAYAHGRGVAHRDIKPDNIMPEAGHGARAADGFGHRAGDHRADGWRWTHPRGRSGGDARVHEPRAGLGGRGGRAQRPVLVRAGGLVRRRWTYRGHRRLHAEDHRQAAHRAGSTDRLGAPRTPRPPVGGHRPLRRQAARGALRQRRSVGRGGRQLAVGGARHPAPGAELRRGARGLVDGLPAPHRRDVDRLACHGAARFVVRCHHPDGPPGRHRACALSAGAERGTPPGRHGVFDRRDLQGDARRLRRARERARGASCRSGYATATAIHGAHGAADARDRGRADRDRVGDAHARGSQPLRDSALGAGAAVHRAHVGRCGVCTARAHAISRAAAGAHPAARVDGPGGTRVVRRCVTGRHAQRGIGVDAIGGAVAKHAGGSAGLADINRSRRADAIR